MNEELHVNIAKRLTRHIGVCRCEVCQKELYLSIIDELVLAETRGQIKVEMENKKCFQHLIL